MLDTCWTWTNLWPVPHTNILVNTNVYLSLDILLREEDESSPGLFSAMKKTKETKFKVKTSVFFMSSNFETLTGCLSESCAQVQMYSTERSSSWKHSPTNRGEECHQV